MKIDQLDVTCFIISLFTAQRVSNVSTSIFRSLRLIVDLFHVLYCSGSLWVGVTVCFGWVVWCPYAGWSLHKDTTPASEDGCTNIRNMLSSKYWNNKASDIKLVYLFNYQDDARSNKHKNNKNLSRGSEVFHAFTRTNITKLIVAFCNFVNAPKKWTPHCNPPDRR